MSKPTTVDHYLADGCGRCKLYATPACKVHRWRDIVVALRRLALASGLEETLKWGMPTYTANGRNVAQIAAFKERCALSLFDGAQLDDPEGLLEAPGEHSQVFRRLMFTELKEVTAHKKAIAGFLAQAAALAESGVRVKTAPRLASTTALVRLIWAHRLWPAIAIAGGRERGNGRKERHALGSGFSRPRPKPIWVATAHRQPPVPSPPGCHLGLAPPPPDPAVGTKPARVPPRRPARNATPPAARC